MNRPRHIKVTGHRLLFAYERCEHDECVVGEDGIATECGKAACPSCGSGGANVASEGSDLHCSCGAVWRALVAA